KADEETTERFLREARATSSIEHDNIVQVFDVGTTPTGEVYLVMEFLQGRDLASLLRGGALPLQRVRHIGRQLCAGLQAAHDKSIVHRDIKPANVFLAGPVGRERVKLVDFGIARLGGVRSLTRQGAVLGTPEYMSP